MNLRGGEGSVFCEISEESPMGMAQLSQVVVQDEYLD